MAAPIEKSLEDLSDTWKMNRALSDDVDGVLEIQGFNSLMRKAISFAPVYLEITQTKDGSSTKYRIDQSTTANIPAVKEEWITDWESRNYKDPVMGPVRSKARWSEPSNVEDSDFLAGAWLDERREQVEAFVEGSGWTAHQIWGFEKFQDERRFVRRVVVQADKRIQKVKLVYDYGRT